MKGDLPKALELYKFYGLDFEVSTGKDCYATCPFCEGYRKLGIHQEDGRWRCNICDKGGGTKSFLPQFWKLCDEKTTDYKELATLRSLSSETLMRWGVVCSVLTGEWMIPGYSVDSSELSQLYVYRKHLVTKKKALLAAPNTRHQLLGVDLVAETASVIYICEGPWDSMLLWEVLSSIKEDGEGRLVCTAGSEDNLLLSCGVIGVPGNGVWKPEWNSLIDGREVRLLYDNDYPKKKASGKVTPPAGTEGMKRVARLISSQASSVQYAHWGKEGFNRELPNGCDVGDILLGKEHLS